MPRILINSDSEQEGIAAERLMRSLAGACSFLVQKNYAAQECMDVLNYLYQKDGVLHIAFNHDHPIDLDHFRMALVTILSAVEGEAGIQRVSIAPPVDIEYIMNNYDQVKQEEQNPS